VSGSFHIGLIMQGGAGWMGGAEYIKNLAQALASAAAAEPGTLRVSLIAGHPLEDGWRQEFSTVEQIINVPGRRRGFLARWLRPANRVFAKALRKHHFDFVFPFTYDNQHNLGVTFPLPLPQHRWSGWIPDFQHRHLPQLFSPEEIAKRDRGIAALAEQAAAIVFSSAACAEDYRRFCPSGKARAEVLRFCTSANAGWFAADPIPVQAKYHLPDRFFLISNQLWQHKNHLLVVEALGLLAEKGVRPHVVCTGQMLDFRDKNHLNLVLQSLHERGVASQVSLLGLIPRAEQIQLMRRCLAVIQPSLSEGWSTVVEDARLLGKDLLLSDLEVHREQNPPGAKFFARSSAGSLADALAEAWEHGLPGPDLPREGQARTEAAAAQLAFGRNFLAIARVTAA
jgi:glycosyltransferase involved in cell wall biosynthesis